MYSASQVLTPPFCGNGSSEMSISAKAFKCSGRAVEPMQMTLSGLQ